ncbi:MAG TPA: thiamine pyrophosphate-binding protein [Thermoflexales bacterium]|nr:thiamine pyrophosphate-binding protein [Thermoflexales bacterium]
MSIGSMTGGEAVVHSLIAQGVDTLFALPGVQNDFLFNALYDRRGEIRVIHTRHEQGAAFMALGYALMRGDVGVYSVVPGPGFLNATAALATAYSLNARVLALIGQLPSAQIGRAEGILHEIPDQIGILRSLTKWAERVNAPSEAPMQVAEAFRQMRSGRPRPVGLEVPMDVLAQRGPVDTAPIALPPYAPPLDHALIEKAAALLGHAQNPAIYVGGGAQGVGNEILALAEALQAPVVAHRTGLGVIDGRNPLSLHLPASHSYWKKVDVVLAIGTYLRSPLTDWGVDANLKVIHLDVDPTTHTILRRPYIALTARAEDALPELIAGVAKHNHPRPSRTGEMLEIKADWAAQTAYLEEQLGYLKVIRDGLGEDGVFVEDLTQVTYAARYVLPVYKPRTYLTTGYQGTLGLGFPTALGAKVARPDLPVIAVVGDGGFMFTSQELATAVQHKIPLVTLVFNNNAYGNVQQMQKNLHGNRVIATDLVNPDFVKLAEAFGAVGLRANTLSELADAIRVGLKASGPTVIDVPHGEMPSVDKFRRLAKVRG